MPSFEQRIMEYLTRPAYRPLKPKSLAKKLGVRAKTMPEFQQAVDRLLEAKKLLQNSSDQLVAGRSSELVDGIVRRISSGAGFLIPHNRSADADKSEDIFISSADLHDAHTGDEVLVRLLSRRGRGGQRCGRVEEIIQRATRTFVGTYSEREGQGYVLVDGRTFTEPVNVGDPGAKGEKPNDKVVIEMLRFPSQFHAGEAVLREILGPRGEPGIDLLSVIHELGLPYEFPEEVMAESRQQAKQFEAADASSTRLDLTKEVIVTIDPADARDFDDAISLKRTPDGHWHLGVHIADVAHYVRPNSALDNEARKRGTSVYLPGRVIPMLPELISNGLASLQQRQLRYTKSAFLEYTPEGILVDTSFANSQIMVTRRFAYEEVMPIINEPQRYRGQVSAKIRKLLAQMHELAMILRKRRVEQGALELHLREVKLVLDDQGKVAEIEEVEHDESHQLIEEFMLAANIAVAQELTDRGLSFLRRVHASPSYQKLTHFAEFVEGLGYSLTKPQSRLDLQALINQVHGKPEQQAINYALLRSLKQAVYSAEEKEHYALGVANYCHFTSPIRRYPDLTVHRLLDRILTGKKKRFSGDNTVELTKLGRHCSITERRAESAERELKRIKLLTLMAERIGEEMEAIITGVEAFGIFCQGVKIPVEGMIHISALSVHDRFDFDSATHSLVGRRSGNVFRLGDLIRVRVAHVDVDARELDFQIVSPPRSRPTSKSKKKPKQKSTPRSKKPTGKKGSKKRRRK